MKKPYLTIKENGEATIEIKKSEFICSLARTETEEEARAFIDEIKTKHRKATHNCFAYMIGLNDEIQRESDNGEPSGTAGVPILEVLKNLELHNVTAVVTRYFGGIKLGAGGLIRAYSNATSNAIEHVGVVRKVVQTELSLKVSYSAWGKLQNYLENSQVNVSDTVFMTDVTAVVYAPAFGFRYNNVREMAAAYCKAPCSVCIETGVEWRETMAKENGISGALVNYNRSCKPWSGAMPEIERRWKEDLGIPVVHFDGDQADERNFSTEQYNTRVQGLVEIMQERKEEKLAKGEEILSPKEEGYHERGVRVNFFSEKRGSERAVEMLVKKIKGEEFETEYPMPNFDRVEPNPAVKDLSKAKIALVTSGGIVPKGNPDHIESSSASKYAFASLAHLVSTVMFVIVGIASNAFSADFTASPAVFAVVSFAGISEAICVFLASRSASAFLEASNSFSATFLVTIASFTFCSAASLASCASLTAVPLIASSASLTLFSASFCSAFANSKD